MKCRKKYPIGSISSGTLRTEDLLSAFLSKYEELASKRAYQRLRREYKEFFKEYDKIEDFDGLSDHSKEEASWLLNETLVESLNELAGPFFHFGAHEGDGADFGFWFSDEAFQDARVNGEVMVINDLADFPTKSRIPVGTEYIALITDHDNVTLYTLRGVEVWSLV